MARQLTVAELLSLCTKKPVDEEAWREFVRRYDSVIKASVMTTFYKRAKQEVERRAQFPDSLAEDLIQLVYVRLLESEGRAIRQFSGESEGSLCSYLSMISVNVVRDHFREARAKKRPKITFSLDQLLEEQRESPILRDAVVIENGPNSQARSTITKEEVDHALNQVLTGDNRERDLLIFKLRFYEGLTLDEIRVALHLDLSTVSVGSVLNRTAVKLRGVLQRSASR